MAVFPPVPHQPSTRPPASDVPHEPRGCLPTVVVLAVMITFPLLAAVALSMTEGMPVRPVRVSDRVTVIPASGWEVERLDERAVYFTNGSATLVVRDVPQRSSPSDALRATLNAWTSDTQVRIVVGEVAPVELGDGTRAVRATYAGTFPDVAAPVEGELTVADISGTLVEFDAWAGEGLFRLVAQEVDTMIRSAAASP